MTDIPKVRAFQQGELVAVPRKPQRSGWKASSYDSRDLVFELTASEQPGDSVLLNHNAPPRHQGWGRKNVPCCVSCSICAAMETIYQRHDRAVTLAELFHYYHARGRSDKLSALNFRDAIKAVIKWGISPHELHPYPPTRSEPMLRDFALKKPSAKSISEAKKFTIPYDVVVKRFKYYSIPRHRRVNKWRAAIKNHNPVIFAFWMTDAYMEISDESSHHPPVESMQAVYCHAVLCLGYDDQINSFLIKDSRGLNFGRNGLWWLDYNLVDSDLIYESWALEGVK